MYIVICKALIFLICSTQIKYDTFFLTSLMIQQVVIYALLPINELTYL